MGLATVSRRAKRSARAGFRIVIVLLEGAEWKPREHIAANGGIEAMVAAMRGHVQDLAVRGGNSLPPLPITPPLVIEGDLFGPWTAGRRRLKSKVKAR